MGRRGGGSAGASRRRSLFTSQLGLKKVHRFDFRYTDYKQAQKLAHELAAKGVKIVLLGHSRGGNVADMIGESLQKAGYAPEVHLFDPVSRNLLFGRDTALRTRGAHVYTPKEGTNGFGVFGWLNNTIATVGGRYAAPSEKQWEGDHVNGMKQFIHDNWTAIMGNYPQPNARKDVEWK